MVIDVGAAAVEVTSTPVRADVATVRAALPAAVVLKVIVESAALLSLGGEQTLDRRVPDGGRRTPALTSSRPPRAFTRRAAPRCGPSS